MAEVHKKSHYTHPLPPYPIIGWAIDWAVNVSNASFAVFEANKLKAAQHQQHVAKYKQVAQEIVDSARDGAADPVEAGVKAHKQSEAVEDEVKPISAAEREQRRLQAWWESDWTPLIEEQQAQMQAERDAAERARRGGFWCG